MHSRGITDTVPDWAKAWMWRLLWHNLHTSFETMQNGHPGWDFTSSYRLMTLIFLKGHDRVRSYNEKLRVRILKVIWPSICFFLLLFFSPVPVSACNGSIHSALLASNFLFLWNRFQTTTILCVVNVTDPNKINITMKVFLFAVIRPPNSCIHGVRGNRHFYTALAAFVAGFCSRLFPSTASKEPASSRQGLLFSWKR